MVSVELGESVTCARLRASIDLNNPQQAFIMSLRWKRLFTTRALCTSGKSFKVMLAQCAELVFCDGSRSACSVVKSLTSQPFSNTKGSSKSFGCGIESNLSSSNRAYRSRTLHPYGALNPKTLTTDMNDSTAQRPPAIAATPSNKSVGSYYVQ